MKAGTKLQGHFSEWWRPELRIILLNTLSRVGFNSRDRRVSEKVQVPPNISRCLPSSKGVGVSIPWSPSTDLWLPSFIYHST
ncbi:unnamed protein product [Nesidiocoris tenuis]|uniref:Uncharacterized protein n=1 Tax=Nesidiocoris tenuis TaxID=355587 RepID=A0A6H5HD38_9HEMI|nr:unnamed protein product [Nesidiocoris tenuis]